MIQLIRIICVIIIVWNFYCIIIRLLKLRRRKKMMKIKKKIKAEKISIKKWRKEYRKYEKWAEKYPILAWLSPRFYRLPDLPRSIKLSIISFLQRGKKGWSNRDTWGLCYYLANVIAESVYHLKKNNHGHPGHLTEGQWIDILNQIIETFQIARELADIELYLIKNKKKRKEWQKSLDELNKTYGGNSRCLTDKEIKRYEKGWDLFRQYFFHLWD